MILDRYDLETAPDCHECTECGVLRTVDANERCRDCEAKHAAAVRADVARAMAAPEAECARLESAITGVPLREWHRQQVERVLEWMGREGWAS